MMAAQLRWQCITDLGCLGLLAVSLAPSRPHELTSTRTLAGFRASLFTQFPYCISESTSKYEQVNLGRETSHQRHTRRNLFIHGGSLRVASRPLHYHLAHHVPIACSRNLVLKIST
ncbi:hypothetical protein BDR03DRAFT_971911 [Suillus americanus]|nr:hypothetical protein BDR03DRAFT_971911 [Suillus americanus]